MARNRPTPWLNVLMRLECLRTLDRTTQKISRRHYWSFRSERRTLR